MDERFAALGYRVDLTEDDGIWVATARRLDTGDAYGPPVPADAPEEAAASLAQWLEWQRDHTAALQALQSATAAYYRLAADRFVAVDQPSWRASARDALARLDDRRRALDSIRERKPWPH